VGGRDPAQLEAALRRDGLKAPCPRPQLSLATQWPHLAFARLLKIVSGTTLADPQISYSFLLIMPNLYILIFLLTFLLLCFIVLDNQVAL
jgi:hypothetical protein